MNLLYYDYWELYTGYVYIYMDNAINMYSVYIYIYSIYNHTYIYIHLYM